MRKWMWAAAIIAVLLVVSAVTRSRSPTTDRAATVPTTGTLARVDQSTETTAPKATTTTVVVNDGRDAEHSVPVGKAGNLPNWSLRVLAVDTDAWDAIKEENQFNDPPNDGHKFVTVRLEVQYTGPGESPDLVWDLTPKAVGVSRVGYDDGFFNCGVIPDSLKDQPRELFTGGTVSGNVCFEVREKDLSSLLLYVDESGGLFTAATVWMDLPTTDRATTVPTTGTLARVDQPTETTAPKATTTTVVVNDGRDAEHSVPVGKAGNLPNWSLRVLAVDTDAWDAIKEENQFNDPPNDGHKFVTVRLEVQYTGPGESPDLVWDLTPKAVGVSRVGYDDGFFNCGVIPDSLKDQPRELFTGGTVSGNVCFEVREKDLSSLLLYVDESGGLFTAATVWMDLPTV